MALNRNWGAILALKQRLDWLTGEQSVFAQLGSVGRAVLATLPDPTPNDDDFARIRAHEGVWEQINELTAATFVLAQREITYFVSAAGWINSRLAAPLQLSISKSDLLGRSPNIELLDAAANYVKHADEWPVDWDEASHRGQMRTIRVLESAGAVDFDSWDPLPLLRRKLGIDRDLGQVANHLHAWGTDVVEQVASELEARNEIPSGWKSVREFPRLVAYRRYLASGL